ncbi:hypothetical protein [Bacillus sp. CGMCC 1.16541]|uniref:hypothetical protein n=1 Tax=Bacillus sp. CGMCC 1.16541 TaxID=2185143 RepID=UPI0013A54504|nr:hypothetical protein [Bacillus sp. CGMCC 1.16541]
MPCARVSGSVSRSPFEMPVFFAHCVALSSSAFDVGMAVASRKVAMALAWACPTASMKRKILLS